MNEDAWLADEVRAEIAHDKIERLLPFGFFDPLNKERPGDGVERIAHGQLFWPSASPCR